MTIVRKGAVPEQAIASSYPDPYNLGAGNMTVRALSDAGGLTRFGAFLETMAPGGRGSQAHWHSHEDEFLYLLDGALTVIEDGVETVLHPGDACVWKAGDPIGHTIRNDTDRPAVYLIVGGREPADVCHYPGLDLRSEPDGTGRHRFVHADGTPYPPRAKG